MAEQNNRSQAPRNHGGGGYRGMRIPGQKFDAKAFKRVFKYLLKYKGRVTLAFICIVISAVVSAFTAIALGTFIDDYIVPWAMKGAIDYHEMLMFLLRIAGIFIAGVVAGYLYNVIFQVMSQKIMCDIRNDMFTHMETLPIKYFDRNSHGDVMSHFTNDTDTLRQLLSQTIPNAASAALTIVVSFFSMLRESVWLTLFVLVMVFLTSILMGKIGGMSGKYFVKQQKSLGSLNGYIEEMINGQKVVKVFNHENATKEEFNRQNEELYQTARRANSLGTVMGPIMNNLGHIQYVLIAVLGAVLATLMVPNVTLGNGVTLLTVGTTIAFLNLSRQFNQTINNIVQQMSAIIMAMAGAKRIFELIDEKPEENEGKVRLVNVETAEDGSLTECEKHTGKWAWKKETEAGNELVLVKGDVKLDHVDFGYLEDKQVLFDINLYAEPGQKVAFVGSTGAGKTTITNLINRFYDIQSGEITYDGIPIREINKNDLRKSLGIVLQDVNLFSGTIMENIRYGKLDATDEEVYAAARLANAYDFITRLPKGFDTEIDGAGSSLSQGQRQLISIARAAIQDPPVMILDEATSSIDTRTEAIVQRGMDSLMKGRTVFVIAHRLSTVQNSDVIMVLEKGVIIERGTHEQLIEQKGKYYQLYTGAFELE